MYVHAYAYMQSQIGICDTRSDVIHCLKCMGYENTYDDWISISWRI